MALLQKMKRFALGVALRLAICSLLALLVLQIWDLKTSRAPFVTGKAQRGKYETALRHLSKLIPSEESQKRISRANTNIPTENRKPCTIPKNPHFPLCSLKIQTLNNTWNNKCHGKRYKVNRGDLCSVMMYLSEVESWCPVFPWRKDHDPFNTEPQRRKAKIRTNLNGVLELLGEKRLAWLRSRLKHTWEEWVDAIKELSVKQNMVGLTRKKIYVFFGTFSFMPWFLADAFKGGALGELVQWTDLIGGLYLLGHDLVVSLNDTEIKRLFLKPRVLTPAGDDGCAVRVLKDEFDFIITDINGYWILERELGHNFSRYRCRLMLLDSFGTDAEFNYEHYTEYLRPNGKSPWGKLNLFLRQFFTMYPHSPDNSFMGFAVPRGLQTATEPRMHRNNSALIYGKNAVHWRGKERYLDELNKHFDVHANVGIGNKQGIPQYVHNHGVLNSSLFMQLLQESKVFVGLGEPYEGPGPLEALANGCFYINPKFQPPRGPLNTPFFDNKPMSRTLTSQNPYAEVFIGKPFVHTINIESKEEIHQAVKEISESKTQPHLPYEFSHEGMLQRLSAYIQHQDFCHPERRWPPISELHRRTGDSGESCIDACLRNDMICENTFFTVVNTAEELSQSGFHCKSHITRESLVAPSFNQTDGSCLLQEQSLLFNCRASAPRIQRLCTCRTYVKEQVALCKHCS